MRLLCFDSVTVNSEPGLMGSVSVCRFVEQEIEGSIEMISDVGRTGGEIVCFCVFIGAQEGLGTVFNRGGQPVTLDILVVEVNGILDKSKDLSIVLGEILGEDGRSLSTFLVDLIFFK
jgi:hypothetical protein